MQRRLLLRRTSCTIIEHIRHAIGDVYASLKRLWSTYSISESNSTYRKDFVKSTDFDLGFSLWDTDVRYMPEEGESLVREIAHRGDPDAHPYADLFYWAGFQIIGW